jgi:hypothetical protein
MSFVVPEGPRLVRREVDDARCLGEDEFEQQPRDALLAESIDSQQTIARRQLDHWGHKAPGECTEHPPYASEGENQCPILILCTGTGDCLSAEEPLNWFDQVICSPELIRFRSVVAILSDISVLIYALLSLAGLALAGYIIAAGRIHRAFHFNLASLATSTTTDSYFAVLETSFVASFFLSLFFGLFMPLWITADRFYISTQPFAGMFKPSPATQNLLLDYCSLAVPSLLLKAIQNEHWRVAWFAFLAVTASLAPVPAAGIFAYAYDRPGSDFKI